MAKKIKIILSSLFITFIGLGFLGNYFSGLVVTPKVKGYDETYQIEIKNKRFTENFYNSLPKEEMNVLSPFGYSIHSIYIPVKNSKKTVIFIHGQTFSLMGSFKYVEIFRKRGFNCLLADNRFHGKSGGKNSTFGFYEKHDLKALVDWVIQRNGKDSVVGFHGESLGSSICLLHAEFDPRPAFYILDGAIYDLTELLSDRLKKDFLLPEFPLVGLASGFSKIRTGVAFSDISPGKTIDKINSPLFFIHGGSDNYISSDHSKRLYEKAKARKKIWICPEADHSKSVIINRKEYDAQIGDFLADLNL